MADSKTECVLAIADGRVFGAGPVEDAGSWFLQEPKTTEVVRMPREAAGWFLFKRWPGRDAALQSLADAQQPAGVVLRMLTEAESTRRSRALDEAMYSERAQRGGSDGR